MQKTLLFTTLFALVCLLSPGRATAQVPIRGTDSQRPVYQLPADPNAPVVVLNFRGGFTAPRTSDEPTLTIFSDGRVVMPQKFANTQAYEDKLSQQELKQLLHFIVGKHDYLNYDQMAVAKKIQAKKQQIAATGGFALRLADAATVEIEVNVNGKSVKSSYYPSGVDESDIEELQHRAAVQRRLQQLIAVVQTGGKAEVAKWLKSANEALLAAHPQEKPLAAEDFQSGAVRADGSVYVRFSRQKLDAQGKPIPRHVTGVVIRQRAEEEKPTVSVTYVRPDQQ